MFDLGDGTTEYALFLRCGTLFPLARSRNVAAGSGRQRPTPSMLLLLHTRERTGCVPSQSATDTRPAVDIRATHPLPRPCCLRRRRH